MSSGASDPSNRSFMWHKRDSRGFITDFYEGGAETERGNPEKFIHISYVRDQYGNKDELIKHNDAGRHDRHFKYYRDWFGREALIFALNKNADGKPPADASGKHNGMDYTRSEKHFDLRGRLVKTVDYRGPLYLSEQKARADILSNYLVQTWGFHPSTGALASYSNGLVQVTYTSDGYGDIFESRLGSGEVIARRSHNHSTRRKQYKSLASVDAGGAPRYITEDRVFDRGAMQTRTLSMGAEQYQARFKYNRMTQVSSQKVLYNGQETQEYEYEYDELGRHVRTYVTGREGGGTERILFGEVEYNLHSVPRWVKNHRGEQVDFEYDDIGRQRAAHYGDTGVKYTYVAHRNWVESATDVEGPKEYRESYQYDRLGNVVKVRDLGLVSSPPPTLEAELYYNSYGVLERLQYPDRSVFEWSKGLDGFVFWEVPAQGEDYLLENRRMIFSTGTEIQSIDPSGRVTSYKYDNLDLLKSITYPDAKTINYEYDGAFRLSQIVRPGSVQTVNARFPGGQLQQATYTEGGSTITRNYYRRNGRPWKISEAGGNSNSLVEWSYDQFGALQREDVQITLSGYPQQSSSVEVNRRNGSGNFDFRTNGIAIQGTQISDVSLEFEYDSFDRVQSLGYSSGQFTLPTTVATFGYQGNQLLNMSSLDGALGTIHYFDLYNRSRGSTTLSTSLFLDGYFVYRNLLGDVDREISFFSPNGGAGRAFRYDELHRPVEELDGVPQQQLHTEPNFANLTYSRRTSIGFSNGGSSEIPAFHRIQRSNGGAPVDELSRSYSLDNKKGYITGGQQLSGNFEIDYDEVGNVIRDESAANGAGRSYRYDALDRLIEVQDLNGVVISRYGYDPSDRLAVIARGEGELTHNIYHHWTLLADESS
ncbi:MAG: RHS repeat protein, partial [Bdellovibrionales bacterium]|nr:RHS repeat protein [Bdellovibrionales bacterium]